MKRKLVRELFMYIASGLCIWFCICLVRDSSLVREGVLSALMRCLNVIIPSLFAFMAAADILIGSGMYIYITKPFGFLARWLFGLRGELVFVIAAAFTAGYPMGVKLLGDMHRKGIVSRRNAVMMSCWCFCGGPAFYCGTVGLGVFGQADIGMCVFLSILLADLLVGIAMRFFVKRESVSPRSDKQAVKLSAQTLTDGVVSAGRSLFVICVMIVFFSAVMSVAEGAGLFELLARVGISENGVTLVKSCLEITCLTELKGSPYYLLPHITAICSFGGVCVLLQVIALGGSFSLLPFILSRFPIAVLSAVICRYLYPFFAPNVVAASSAQNVVFVKINNFVPSICLIMMILLLILKKRLAFYKTV